MLIPGTGKSQINNRVSGIILAGSATVISRFAQILPPVLTGKYPSVAPVTTVLVKKHNPNNQRIKYTLKAPHAFAKRHHILPDAIQIAHLLNDKALSLVSNAFNDALCALFTRL